MSQHENSPTLLINTAFQDASVAIAVDGKLIDQVLNPVQKEHASFLHPAIQTLCKNNGITLNDFKAISVINGPGSYTGLRVGLSAAKGICYAKQLPLICINSLEWIAYGNKEQAIDLVAPMIDARRMEVFTAIYSKNMELDLPPTNLILDDKSFLSYLNIRKVLFAGDGMLKWKSICIHENAQFGESLHDENHHAQLADQCFSKKEFASLFSASPFYTKDFYSTQK